MFKKLFARFKKTAKVERLIVGSWESKEFPHRAVITDHTVKFIKKYWPYFVEASDATHITPRFRKLPTEVKLKLLTEFWIATLLYANHGGLSVYQNEMWLMGLATQLKERKRFFLRKHEHRKLFQELLLDHHYGKVPQIIERLKRSVPEAYTQASALEP